MNVQNTRTKLDGEIVPDVSTLPIVSAALDIDRDDLHDHEDVKNRQVDDQASTDSSRDRKGSDGFDDIDDSVIITSGAIAAQHMLSARDDGDPAITVRSLFLGTATATFYAVMSQIYLVSRLAQTGTFLLAKTIGRYVLTSVV